MKIRIEIDENALTKLIMDYLCDRLDMDIERNKVEIQVKSKQNYKAEWEKADFRCVYEAHKN